MKTISIFDLDDSLTETPTFSSFVGAEDGQKIDTFKYYPAYFKSVKSMFWDKLSKDVIFKRLGDFVVPINASNDKGFTSDSLEYFNGDKRKDKMFAVKNDVVTLKPFAGFHADPTTIGKKINEPVYEAYVSAENKMILTGRDEKLRKPIEDTLKELGIECPNFGLKMYSGNSGIKNWKAHIIIQTIQENKWEQVDFYEDRQDWLHYAEGCVKEKYPNVKFVAHFVSNIKDKHKF
jgi:hypothetical protein